MAGWLIDCPMCKTAVVVAEILPEVAAAASAADPFEAPLKPYIPNQGLHVQCPRCKREFVCRGFQLRYQA
jgi:phage FluMu protein Com